MAKNTCLILMLIILLNLTIINLVSADTTKLVCLEKDEIIEFSKCNPDIPDRTCNNNGGCQFCVKEISDGVYCQRIINECNNLGLTCELDQESSITNINIDQNASSNENKDNNETTVSVNNKKIENNNDILNEENSVDVSGNTIASTSKETNQEKNADNIVKGESKLKSSPVFQILILTSVIEFIMLSFLLGYISGKKSDKKRK